MFDRAYVLRWKHGLKAAGPRKRKSMLGQLRKMLEQQEKFVELSEREGWIRLHQQRAGQLRWLIKQGETMS